jgi:tetratricopeptide (TPR) repeat protein
MDAEETEQMVLRYNQLAMQSLPQEKYRHIHSLLNKALDLLNAPDTSKKTWPNRLKLLGVTLNNFGCLYKYKGQPNVALFYLQKAMKVEQTTLSDNLAESHLNICAILSQLNHHKAALFHAQEALEVLRTRVETRKLESAEAEDRSSLRSFMIAYHNVAAELEHLNRIGEAVEQYEKAEVLSREVLNPEHPLSVNIRANCKKAKEKSRNHSILLSERQILRHKARVNSKGRSLTPLGRKTPQSFIGLEAIQMLPSIKQEMQRVATLGSARRLKSKRRFQRINYSLS